MACDNGLWSITIIMKLEVAYTIRTIIIVYYVSMIAEIN